MIVICCGMYRACTTWQYEVVTYLLKKLSAIPLSNVEAAELKYQYATGLRIAKTHEAQEDYAKLLREEDAQGIYAYRDIRDVVPSLARKMMMGVDELLDAKIVERMLAADKLYRSCPNTLVQRYETIVSNPSAAVLEIACHLEVDPSSDMWEEVASFFSLEERRKRDQGMYEAAVDAGLDPFSDDARLRLDANGSMLYFRPDAGKSGLGPSQMTPEQLERIESIAGDWLRENGYA